MKPWFRPRDDAATSNPARVLPASWQGWLVEALYYLAMIGSVILTLYVMRMVGTRGAVLFLSLFFFAYVHRRIVARHFASPL